MAHTKAGGSTRQKGNRRGKHLGVKVYGGQKVATGNILIRQKGSSVHAGAGVGTGHDFTLFALKSGILRFIRRRGQHVVSVVSAVEP